MSIDVNSVAFRRAWAKVIAEAWWDQDFRAALESDAGRVLREQGADIPEGTEVSVFDEPLASLYRQSMGAAPGASHGSASLASGTSVLAGFSSSSTQPPPPPSCGPPPPPCSCCGTAPCCGAQAQPQPPPGSGSAQLGGGQLGAFSFPPPAPCISQCFTSPCVQTQAQHAQPQQHPGPQQQSGSAQLGGSPVGGATMGPACFVPPPCYVACYYATFATSSGS
jgi:hypothetical protein